MVAWLQENRPELYKANKEFYEDALFGIIKIIASENLEVANQLYLKHLKSYYRPSPTQNHSTRFYLILYKIFGFKRAEIIRRWLGKKE